MKCYCYSVSFIGMKKDQPPGAPLAYGNICVRIPVPLDHSYDVVIATQNAIIKEWDLESAVITNWKSLEHPNEMPSDE